MLTIFRFYHVLRIHDDMIPRKKIFQTRVDVLRKTFCWPLIVQKKTKSEILYTIGCLICVLNVGAGLLITLYATVEFAVHHGQIDLDVYNDIMLFVMSMY